MPRRNRQGFTLIEVLVVLLITSIIMAVLISVLGSSFEILRLGETRAQLYSNARTAVEYIAKDLAGASYIPIAADRDLNGYPDEWANPALNPNAGYGTAATWRVSEDTGTDIVTWARVLNSEAWTDRMMAVHSSRTVSNPFGPMTQTFTVPRILSSAGAGDVVEYTTFYRLAIPANAQMPYYLAPPGKAGAGGVIPGYPEYVALGQHKETAALIQDIFYEQRNSEEPLRVRQIPVASNITRITFEYLQEVPVYLSRVNSGDVEIAFQDLTDGSLHWNTASPDPNTSQVPVVDHWEQRVIDVSPDLPNSNDGNWHDDAGAGATNALYGVNGWNLADQYPEEDETVDPGRAAALNTWNAPAFYNIPGDDPINAPVDRMAYVTFTADANGNPIEGGMAALRPDMQSVQGVAYQSAIDALDANASGTFGDADGIPDGDGLPDNPVPGWWLPYISAVRITVVATPARTIEDRIAASGKAGSVAGALYYRLDSPVPYSDAARSLALLNREQDYVGAGHDVIVTRVVPVNFAYRLEPITDHRDPRLSENLMRRVDMNYSNGINVALRDPLANTDNPVPATPYEKLLDLDPSLP